MTERGSQHGARVAIQWLRRTTGARHLLGPLEQSGDVEAHQRGGNNAER